MKLWKMILPTLSFSALKIKYKKNSRAKIIVQGEDNKGRQSAQEKGSGIKLRGN